MLRHAGLTVLLATAAACAARQANVPVVGAAGDVSALAGQWAGDYSSNQSGRAGSITFTLRAAGDSAFGDVMMVPASTGRALMPWRGEGMGSGAQQRPQPEVLTINFVRVQGGEVSGTLAPYADPESGARLVTTFSGQMSGGTISGVYTTRLPNGDTQTGRWTVQRR
jgi:hypothetical protein